MNEILFKAKSIDNKRWVEGYYFARPILEKHFILCDGAQWQIDKNTLCQYVGLTDKNKEKIWRGDAVTIPGEDGYFVVEWEEDTARFVLENYEERFSVNFDNFWAHELEVVGNIFDNPEYAKTEPREKEKE